MNYYIPSTNQTTSALPPYATPETCREYGLWPIYDGPFSEDPRYWTRIPGQVEFHPESQTYTQHWQATPLPLPLIKIGKHQEFDEVFLHLETKQSRPVASLTIRIVEGTSTFPETDFDAGLLWSIEQIKEENRLLLKSIADLEITEEMTPEDVDTMLREAIATVPWIPDGASLQV